jgi:hypothetical protein
MGMATRISNAQAVTVRMVTIHNSG